jgi:hypothetical protein
VETYGTEMWVINKEEEKTLMNFERKRLRKIFGSVMEDNQWKIRLNAELEELCKNVNICTCTKV